jgi:TolB protein
MRKSILALLIAVAALVLPALPAQATFPGDNGRIAFRRFLNFDRTWGAVFTANPDGSHEFQVTHPPEGYVDRNPDVSPDGRRITFQRESVLDDVPCADDIYVVNTDGSHLTRLTGADTPDAECPPDVGWGDAAPAWSPDGREIAFYRGSGPIVDDLVQRQAIYVMNADGSHIRLVTQKFLATGEDSDPQWSPDGSTLVFQRRNVRSAQPADGVAIWTIRLDTGRERRVTPYDLNAGDTPDWSPDGRRILFHDNLDMVKPDISPNLFTIRPDGTGLKQLTFATGGVIQHLGSSYSPDGKWITFARKPATGGTQLNTADVFIMRVDGTDERPVTRTDLYDSYPDWGPRPVCPHH